MQFENPRLFCDYFTNGNPGLLLLPVRREVLSLQPYVVLYHNFITDAEAEDIKRLAQPGVSVHFPHQLLAKRKQNTSLRLVRFLGIKKKEPCFHNPIKSSDGFIIPCFVEFCQQEELCYFFHMGLTEKWSCKVFSGQQEEFKRVCWILLKSTNTMNKNHGRK